MLQGQGAPTHSARPPGPGRAVKLHPHLGQHCSTRSVAGARPRRLSPAISGQHWPAAPQGWPPRVEAGGARCVSCASCARGGRLPAPRPPGPLAPRQKPRPTAMPQQGRRLPQAAARGHLRPQRRHWSRMRCSWSWSRCRATARLSRTRRMRPRRLQEQAWLRRRRPPCAAHLGGRASHAPGAAATLSVGPGRSQRDAQRRALAKPMWRSVAASCFRRPCHQSSLCRLQCPQGRQRLPQHGPVVPSIQRERRGRGR